MCAAAYITVTGLEGVVVEHLQAVRAVTGGAVHLPPSALANKACGVANLPAIDKQCWICIFSNYSTIGHCEIIK